MSSEIDNTPTSARDPYGPLDLDREEGITTVSKELPAGARHGGGGKFILDDHDRNTDDVFAKFDVGDDGRNLPDGSVYQHARAVWYANENEFVEDPEGRKYAVLSRSYEHPHEDEDDQYAVTLRSSRYEAGTGEGDDYRPWYKYDLTVRPIDEDSSIEWGRTPPRSLSLKLEPQYAELVYPDGNDFRLPHGEGTLVRVQTTWIEQSEEFIGRAAHLLGHTLNYGLRQYDVVRDSAAFSKAEVHHRVTEDVEGDLVHTIRQSAELLARHNADVETRGVHEESKWLKCKIRTEGWEQLGFPRIDAPILLKFYYPDDPDAVDFPMDQPKIEVALDGKETVIDEETGRTTEKMIPWGRWDEIMAILDEILLSHLEWADVSAADLLADDYSDGAQNPRTRWRHPEGRRHWLRKHYESLVPALYREATRTRTDLVLDILDVVRRRGRATYEELIDETGAARRTIREHVRRLAEDVGGDDAPGILSRDHGAVVTVSYSSRFLEELGEDAVDSIQAEREELTEDREDRADDRLLDELCDRGLEETSAEDLVDAVNEDDTGEIRYQRSDIREADDLEELHEIAEDLGVAIDVTSEDDADQEEADDDRDDVETWTAFSALPIDPDTLAYALEDGSVEGDHVRVRVDPYPTLSG